MINRETENVEGVNLTGEHHTNLFISDLTGGVSYVCVEPFGSFRIEVHFGVKLQVRGGLSNRIALIGLSLSGFDPVDSWGDLNVQLCCGKEKQY